MAKCQMWPNQFTRMAKAIAALLDFTAIVVVMFSVRLCQVCGQVSRGHKLHHSPTLGHLCSIMHPTPPDPGQQLFTWKTTRKVSVQSFSQNIPFTDWKWNIPVNVHSVGIVVIMHGRWSFNKETHFNTFLLFSTSFKTTDGLLFRNTNDLNADFMVQFPRCSTRVNQAQNLNR